KQSGSPHEFGIGPASGGARSGSRVGVSHGREAPAASLARAPFSRRCLLGTEEAGRSTRPSRDLPHIPTPGQRRPSTTRRGFAVSRPPFGCSKGVSATDRTGLGKSQDLERARIELRRPRQPQLQRAGKTCAKLHLLAPPGCRISREGRPATARLLFLPGGAEADTYIARRAHRAGRNLPESRACRLGRAGRKEGTGSPTAVLWRHGSPARTRKAPRRGCGRTSERTTGHCTEPGMRFSGGPISGVDRRFRAQQNDGSPFLADACLQRIGEASLQGARRASALQRGSRAPGKDPLRPEELLRRSEGLAGSFEALARKSLLSTRTRSRAHGRR